MSEAWELAKTIRMRAIPMAKSTWCINCAITAGVIKGFRKRLKCRCVRSGISVMADGAVRLLQGGGARKTVGGAMGALCRYMTEFQFQVICDIVAFSSPCYSTVGGVASCHKWFKNRIIYRYERGGLVVWLQIIYPSSAFSLRRHFQSTNLLWKCLN